jgi:SAM-dependent methyltransferase
VKASTDKNCRLCNSNGPHTVFQAIEMMYGTREKFDYFECFGCGTVQIVNDLEQSMLAAHYPSNYYSFNMIGRLALKEFFRTKRDMYLLGQGTVVGSLMALYQLDFVMSLIGNLKLSTDSRILDVGCGAGDLLNRLGKAGFTNLLGADPFIERRFVTTAGAIIEKSELKEVAGRFDLIMFHHSLEHVPDPRRTLREARVRLNRDGLCIVRVPTVSSAAWQEYRENWFQLDAPRHFVLPSRMGMKIAAERAGFKLINTVDDSYGASFEHSESYRAGIPLFGDQPRPVINAKQKKEFAQRAKVANAASLGDQAAFVFQAV